MRTAAVLLVIARASDRVANAPNPGHAGALGQGRENREHSSEVTLYDDSSSILSPVTFVCT
jgi:hypothetical protein